MATRTGWSPGPAAWKDDLTPIAAADWNYDRAAHLLAHAGFGGTPAEIEKLADARPRARGPLARALREHPESEDAAVRRIGAVGSDAERVSREPARSDRSRRSSTASRWASRPSRPATVRCSRSRTASSTGCARRCSKRAGSATGGRTGCCRRRIRWKQKMALLWHGHFATHENKVRDYRKMMQQIDLFERGATGNLRDLTIQVAQNPAMLYFLDAQYNVKGAAERELRPRGDGALHHGRRQLLGEGRARSARARSPAGTSTTSRSRSIPDKHDDGAKTFLGRTGNFDGVDVLKIIFEQPVTAEYLAGKIYRFLVRDELSPELRKKLGAVLRDSDYEVKPLLTVIFSSKDFYSQASYGGAHQGAGRAPGRDDEAPGRRRHAGRARLQPVDHRDGPASAESAVGGGLGGRQGVDHAGPADRARQRRARCADPRHDRLQGLELHRRQRRRARPPAARRLRHRRGHGRQRPVEDDARSTWSRSSATSGSTRASRATSAGSRRRAS